MHQPQSQLIVYRVQVISYIEALSALGVIWGKSNNQS